MSKAILILQTFLVLFIVGVMIAVKGFGYINRSLWLYWAFKAAGIISVVLAVIGWVFRIKERRAVRKIFKDVEDNLGK